MPVGRLDKVTTAWSPCAAWCPRGSRPKRERLAAQSEMKLERMSSRPRSRGRRELLEVIERESKGGLNRCTIVTPSEALVTETKTVMNGAILFLPQKTGA